MKDEVLSQLHDLAKAFNKIDIKPVICGGLGIYLKFYSSKNEIELRATNDIDLMLTETQVKSQADRNAVLKTIKDDLHYVLRAQGQCFMFEKSPYDKLDILAPPIQGLTRENDNRVKLVKSKLHGRLTPEAQFIEEDLETVPLHNILSVNCNNNCEIQVPSAVNLLILKLFAFDDRYAKKDTERAQTHAYDIFVIAELSNRADYLQAKEFILRHAESDIIRRAKSVVLDKFDGIQSSGWLSVPRMSLAANLDVSQRNQKIEHAAKRLLRWFED
ncbi:MAG: nucleotidyl transferase AbiEii/AbiGii toxin family protein [Phycisphaerae bacterium]